MLKQHNTGTKAMADVFITNKIHVRKNLVNMKRIDKLFTKNIYNESGCAKCPFAPDRPVEECTSGCPNFLGALKLWTETNTKSGGRFVSLPPGNVPRIKKILDLPDDIIWKDKRRRHKFDYKIKFTWDLYDGSVVKGRKTVNQRELIDKWVESGRSGLIQAPPRSGKSPTSIAGMIESGCKFVIIAHESRLLKQFYKTMMGDKRKGIPPATNLPMLQKKTGKKLVAVVNNIKKDLIDNPDLQIVLITYQKFIKDKTATKRIKVLNERFSGFIVDEAHQSAALAYLKFLSRLTMRYRMMLSATPRRKDGLDWCMHQFGGPVVAKATTVAITPRIELVETGVTSGKYNYRSWVGMLKFLANNKERNKLIIRDIFKDLRSGRQGIIIPVDHKPQGQLLVDLINRQARINREKRGEKWPKQTAAFYNSATKEKGIIEDFDAGKIKVLVGIRSMIKQGIDMASPDTLYMVIPMSASSTGAAGAPIFEQLSYRPATWTPKKKDPVLRLFIDGVSFSSGCFRGLFWKEIVPGLKAQKGKPPKYRMNPEDFDRAVMIAKQRSYTPHNKPGERVYSKDLITSGKDEESKNYRASKYNRNRDS